MAENVLGKLTSSKWLREAIGGRVKVFVNSRNFSPYIIDREVAGETHKFFIGSPTGKSWYGGSFDQSLEMDFVKHHLLKPGAVVFECGAHHGAQTILLSRWVGPQGKVVAIEPMAENVPILRRNVDINQLSNVIVVDKAVGSPRATRLFMSSASNASVRQSGTPVQSVTLDGLAESLKLAPSLLKIDVEGYEYEILEGSRSVLATNPAIFIEVHTLTLPRYGRKFQDLWTFIDPDKYNIFIQDEDFKTPEPFSPTYAPTSRVHLFFCPKRQ